MILRGHPSISETTSGESGPFRISNGEVIALFIDVTAVSGSSPTLDVKVQDSPDATTWYDVPGLANTQFTATGSERKAPTTIGQKLGPFIRLVFTIGGGTPDFTFKSDIAVLSYEGDEV